jgi:hypothetical protein
MRRLFYPYLFAIFPALFLFARNADQMRADELIMPLAIVLLITTVLLLVFRLLVRAWTKAAIITTLLLLFFFSFGHIRSLLPPFYIPIGNTDLMAGEVLLLVMGAVWIIVSVIIVMTKLDYGKVTPILNVVAGILVAIQLVQAGVTVFQRGAIEEAPSELAETLTVPKDPPDIYYIIMDGFGREDVLRDTFNCGTVTLYERLRKAGFYVATDSYANYIQTLLSMTSSLNLGYIQDFEGFDPHTWDRVGLSSKMRDNLFFKTMKSIGYRTVSFVSGFQLTRGWDTDIRLSPGLTLSDYQNILLNTTPLPLFLIGRRTQYEIHRDRIKYILSKLPEIDEASSPMIVLAHVIAPHPPFVFGAEGQPVQRDWPPFSYADGYDWRGRWGTIEVYRQSYCAQATYVSKLLWNAVSELLKKYHDRPPVIIIQGDHGPGSRLHWRSVEKSDLHERFGILNAYYFPGSDTAELYPGISPVNSFRVMFDARFGANLPLLEDHFYFSHDLKPFDFQEVTDRLRPNKEPDTVGMDPDED